jgi:G3E family GTPase
MKLAVLTGLGGSGKTSIINFLAAKFIQEENKVGVVLNDQGEEQLIRGVYKRCIPQESLSTMSLPPVSRLFQEILLDTCLSENLDYLFVEPSGIARSWFVKKESIIVEAALKTKFAHAPVINVVDPTRIELMLRAMKNFLRNGIMESDYIAVNKTDIAPDDLIQKTEKIIRNLCPEVPVFHVSAKTHRGLEEVFRVIAEGETKKYVNW